MKVREKRREEIVSEYLAGDGSYRDLEARYGISSSTLHRWVIATGLRSEGREGGVESPEVGSAEVGAGKEIEGVNLAAEVKRLRAELDRSELHVKLLNAMIDIAEDELKVPIRKKRGAKR